MCTQSLLCMGYCVRLFHLMSRYNHYLPLTDNETEPRELGTQDLTMESALRVHTLNTIGRELNYGQNSTSLVQWVGSRET